MWGIPQREVFAFCPADEGRFLKAVWQVPLSGATGSLRIAAWGKHDLCNDPGGGTCQKQGKWVKLMVQCGVVV